MNCPHVNEFVDCKDCPDYPCTLLTPAVADAMLEQAKARATALPDCDTCPVMRLVSDYWGEEMRLRKVLTERLAEEQAWMTGDSDHFHELYCGKGEQ